MCSQNTTSRIQDTNSTNTSQCLSTFKPSSSVQFYNDNIVDRGHFRIHRHDTNSLIATIKELQMQNKSLHRELLEYQEINTINKNLHTNIRHLTSEVTALKAK